MKVQRRDYTNRPPVLAPLRRALPCGAAARAFRLHPNGFVPGVQ